MKCDECLMEKPIRHVGYGICLCDDCLSSEVASAAQPAKRGLHQRRVRRRASYKDKLFIPKFAQSEGKRRKKDWSMAFTMVDLWAAFVAGAREMKTNPTASDYIIQRTANAYVQGVQIEKTPNVEVSDGAPLTDRKTNAASSHHSLH